MPTYVSLWCWKQASPYPHPVHMGGGGPESTGRTSKPEPLFLQRCRRRNWAWSKFFWKHFVPWSEIIATTIIDHICFCGDLLLCYICSYVHCRETKLVFCCNCLFCSIFNRLVDSLLWRNYHPNDSNRWTFPIFGAEENSRLRLNLQIVFSCLLHAHPIQVPVRILE